MTHPNQCLPKTKKKKVRKFDYSHCWKYQIHTNLLFGLPSEFPLIKVFGLPSASITYNLDVSGCHILAGTQSKLGLYVTIIG